MSTLPYQDLKALCQTSNLIHPWVEKGVFGGKTYGLSECGYDIRIKQDVTLYPVTLKYLMLNALGFTRRSFCLASTIERFCIPPWLKFDVYDKSSWAREGLTVQNTTAEPGWEGWLTLELGNQSDKIIHLAAGTPIAQIQFETLTRTTIKPYKGKYSNQGNFPQPALYETSK